MGWEERVIFHLLREVFLGLFFGKRIGGLSSHILWVIVKSVTLDHHFVIFQQLVHNTFPAGKAMIGGTFIISTWKLSKLSKLHYTIQNCITNKMDANTRIQKLSNVSFSVHSTCCLPCIFFTIISSISIHQKKFQRSHFCVKPQIVLN